MSCEHCNNDPCHAIEFDEVLRGAFDAFPADTPANVARRLLYSTSCVLRLVREISPDPAGEYMGHKNSHVH